MASMVYQGLQSCLDHQSQLVESSWTFRLRLSSPKLTPPPLISSPQPPFEFAFQSSTFLDSTPAINNKELNHPDHNSINRSSWSFLQSLSTTTSKPAPIKETPLIDQHPKQEAVYVHPLVKRSRSSLSEKSLKLCTENLGNETGVDDYTDTGVFPPLLSNSTTSLSRSVGTTTRKQLAVVSTAGQHMTGTKKTTTKGNNNIREKSYPPPLTTIRGSESIRVRPHREDGRLIIKAEKVQDRRESCFQAERSQGRLRLCVLKFVNVDHSAQEKEEVENIDGEDDQGQDFGGEENVGEVYVNKESYGGENGTEKLTERTCSRSSCCSRCKEADEKDKKGIMVLNNREPFCVAT